MTQAIDRSDKGTSMFKLAKTVALIVLAAVVVQSLPDIARYVRMRNM